MLGGIEYTAALSRLRSLAGAAGAALIGFSGSGEGALPRTLEEKALEICSVKDYKNDSGARVAGNATTNDQTGITKARNAASGRALFYPKGDYLISSDLAPLSNQKWYGEGAQNTTIRTATNNVDLISAVDKSHIEICGIRFVGAGGASNGNGILLQDTDHVYIHDCEFEGFSNHGVRAYGVTGLSEYIVVENCYFHDWNATLVQDSAGIAFMSNTRFCEALHNRILCYSWHGVHCQDNVSTVGFLTKGHKIVGNTINRKKGYGIVNYEPNSTATITNCANNGSGLIRVTAAGHGFQTDTEVLISGVTGTTEANGAWIVTRIDANNFDLKSSAFANAYAAGGTAQDLDIIWTLIDGNTIYDIEGSALLPALSAGAGVYLVGAGHIRVTNNHIFNTNIDTAVDDLSPAGIGINGMEGHAVVANNLVERCNWYGIEYVSATLTGRCTITGNTVRYCKRAAIFINNANYATVTGNNIEVGRDGPAANGGIWFQAPALCKGFVASGNVISSYLHRPFLVQFAEDFSITGNVIVNLGTGVIEGMILEDSAKGVVSGNVIDLGSVDQSCLRFIRCTETLGTNNVLKNGGTTSFIFLMTGVCTGSRFDESNYVNNHTIYNNSTGGFVAERHTGAPVNAHRNVGDLVYNTAPTAGGTIGWVATTAGDPPTWKTWGAIAA